MKRVLCLSLLAGFAASIAQAQHNISTANGNFTPSFRGSGNTTFFGWGSGSFDGATANELIDNPATTLGSGIGVTFNQSGTNDILSSGNNIYTGFAPGPTDLLIAVPTQGTQGTGYTTIIVQGTTAFGALGALPTFNILGGDAVEVVTGLNAIGSGQFWAKYEILGNETSYNMVMTVGNEAISIAQLVIDTQWSSLSHAADFAIVPEPSSLALLAIGGLAVALRRSRKV